MEITYVTRQNQNVLETVSIKCLLVEIAKLIVFDPVAKGRKLMT